MGYTHYWQARPIEAHLWAIVRRDMLAIFAATKPALAAEYDTPRKPPVCDEEHIAFNGRGDYGHETFWIDRNGSGFGFCKTAGKPYDTPVTAVLIYLAAMHSYEVSSDGTREDWQAGLALARTVWPHLALSIPASIED